MFGSMRTAHGQWAAVRYQIGIKRRWAGRRRKKGRPAGEVERGESGELVSWSGLSVNETRRPPETESAIYKYTRRSKSQDTRWLRENAKDGKKIAWIFYFCQINRPILLQSIRSFTRIKHQLCDTLQALSLYHRIDFRGKTGSNRLFRLGLTSDGLLVTLGKGLGLTLLAALLPKQETRQSKPFSSDIGSIRTSHLANFRSIWPRRSEATRGPSLRDLRTARADTAR